MLDLVPERTDFEFLVRVVSNVDNEAIDRATITVDVRGETLRARTGSDGRGMVRVPDEYSGTTGDLVVNASNYVTEELSVTLRREGQLVVELEPVATVQARASETPITTSALTATVGPTVTSVTAVPLLPTRDSDDMIAVVSDVHGNPDIYLMTMEGIIIQQITDDAAEERHLAWSSDGNSLAYASDAADKFDIYVYDFTTGSTRSPIANNLGDSAPNWSPDGTKLVFHSYVSEENADIFIMDLNREADYEHFVASEAEDWQPTWSPDGTKIAFMTNRDGNWEIYIRDVNGLNEINLTHNSGNDYSPEWSPDGNYIAFSSDRDGDSDIYVIVVANRSVRQLTNNTWGDWTPSWSPDGSQIVFSSLRNGNYDIYVINADGSGERRIVENNAKEEYPTFRPVERP